MSYFNGPVVGDSFDPAAFAAIDRIVHDNHDQEILLHCSSSNRVGGWLAVHLVENHDMSVDDALAVGRRAGITSPVIEERVRALLAARSGESQAPADVEGPDALEPQARLAQQSLVVLKQGLQSTLKSALAESPAAAVEACHIAAPSIEGNAQSPGIEVGRTSHKTRNPVNDPEDWMVPLLDHYLETPMTVQPARVVDLGERGVGYVEPIYMQPLCATCHGTAVAPDLLALIGRRYPHDRALGFAPGELRGLFWVVVSREATDSAMPEAPSAPH
jgi:hypothetical protein